MTGLVLKLGPHERILINGAVIENGDRRSRLNIVTPNANILRLKDDVQAGGSATSPSSFFPATPIPKRPGCSSCAGSSN